MTINTELIDLDAILANYNANAPELTQAEIDMFDIDFLLESTDTDILYLPIALTTG